MNLTTMGKQLWWVNNNSAFDLLRLIYFLFFSNLLSLQYQHLAASKGKENCVLHLLDSGADPNIRGRYFLPLS